MFELRWLIRDDVEVLQYRTTITVPDYSTKTDDGKYVSIKKWNEWQDVPTVEDK